MASIGFVRRIETSSRLLLLATVMFLCGAGAAHGDDRVYASPEAVQPLAVGAVVPSARVRTVSGESIDLAELVRDAGALLVFYRGGW